jgi:hypothetical protein
MSNFAILNMLNQLFSISYTEFTKLIMCTFISKYLNSNFGKYLGRLRHIIFMCQKDRRTPSFHTSIDNMNIFWKTF